MVLPEMMALFRYWRDHPPVHVMVAAWLGVGPRDAAEPTEIEAELEAGGETRPFDCLPTEIQAEILEARKRRAK
jgi:hypothetical protein